MMLRIGVGLAAAVLLSFAARPASACRSDGADGGNAWGTELADMKSTASASVGNGNGHAWGLLLADIKARGHGEDADDQGEDEGNGGGSHHWTRSGGGVGSPPHDVAAVPEPSAALLFAAGTGLVLISLRRPQA